MDGGYCSIIAAIDDVNGDCRWFSREKENHSVSHSLIPSNFTSCVSLSLNFRKKIKRKKR